MTFSIVARDKTTRYYGISVASRFFAAGAVVPHLAGQVGAIATQALVSPIYGTEGLSLLRSGVSAQRVIDTVVARDNGSHSRQIHLIDAKGRAAAFTGDKCIDWCGHLIEDNVTVAGNMLSGPQVVDAAMETYLANSGLPLEERLLTAMEAAEAAGGDKRGRQSAALKIVHDEDYPWLDIRSDDHAAPLEELRRLHAVAQERYLHFAELMPTRENIHGLLDRTEIDRKIADLEAEREKAGRSSASFATPPS
ncbi:DUF1028 domain-containing protein [uncultured Roseibium sp.]|uniref:DUF1028 domain-containing protein n=1 Tax=uncultured Roseibium sp. TaxID=1936171 RepID=UPI0026303556|nr:DUF1028 domain-containing protein [uncultured Roseibium sp.]